MTTIRTMLLSYGIYLSTRLIVIATAAAGAALLLSLLLILFWIIRRDLFRYLYVI
jgi:hypothetical protein